MFKIAIKILCIFYILLNKPMDLTKKKNLIRQKKKHFDIISSTFPFKVQMTYGDNDITAHYVYSNSGRECAMIFFLAKLAAYETQDFEGNALKSVSMSVWNSLSSGTKY